MRTEKEIKAKLKEFRAYVYSDKRRGDKLQALHSSGCVVALEWVLSKSKEKSR